MNRIKKVFKIADIDKNIPGFSDTEQKLFILKNSIGFRKNSKVSKEFLDKYYQLTTDTYDDFLEMVAFVDLLCRQSPAFKFAEKLHLENLHDKKSYPIYSKYYKKVVSDGAKAKLNKERTRLDSICHNLKNIINVYHPCSIQIENKPAKKK